MASAKVSLTFEVSASFGLAFTCVHLRHLTQRSGMLFGLRPDSELFVREPEARQAFSWSVKKVFGLAVWEVVVEVLLLWQF